MRARFTILSAVALLTACADDRLGGLATVPEANAGRDRMVTVGERVELVGRGSDPEGDPLTFAWSLLSAPEGSAATLDDPDAIRVSFTVDREGDYLLQLVVDDGNRASRPDTVLVTTLELPENTRPVADAGPDRSVNVGSAVDLDGRGSFDADGDVLTYRWSVLTQPPGASAPLMNATTPTPRFTPSVEGAYRIELVVSDGTEDSEPDELTVLAGIVNRPPQANAGADQTVVEGDMVTLDGTMSFDPDAQPLTYRWTFAERPPGSAARLMPASAMRPIFTADVAGSYRVELVVDDGIQASAPDFVEIVANARPMGSGHRLTLPTNELVSDPGRGLLYASVPSTSPVSGTGNTVVKIDPTTGAVTDMEFVGSEPGSLALSDDGRWLYVGLNGTNAVRRVDLDTFTAADQFSLPATRYGDQRIAGPMVVLPGSPDTVAISTHRIGVSPSFAGVAVFDSGVIRSAETPGHTGSSRLVGGTGTTLYGFNNLHTGFGFYVLNVTAEGVERASESRDLIGGFSTDIIYDNGWVIATSGQAVDVAGPNAAGMFAANGPVAADPTRVYFLSGDSFAVDRLVAFDRSTFVPIGEAALSSFFPSGVEGTPTDLVRWGDDGLAFRSGARHGSSSDGSVYILRSELVMP